MAMPPLVAVVEFVVKTLRRGIVDGGPPAGCCGENSVAL